jgi:hypothetical protein
MSTEEHWGTIADCACEPLVQARSYLANFWTALQHAMKESCSPPVNGSQLSQTAVSLK